MKEIKECLSGFRFKELFTEHLMWDSSKGNYAIEAGDSVCEVQAVAEKRGLVVLICRPTEGAPFPGSAERKRIEREVTKLHHEHIIVFVDREQTRQVWQVPKREGGKTTAHSEVPFFKGKGVEHLARRIEAISFTLDESEKVSLIEVSARVNHALLAEKVTKKFFKEFSDQRKAFVKFLDWIEDETKRDWYCSVLLNRIMFIYFLGGKGFLPGGTKFLGQSLENNAGVNGLDTFYTHFLLPLSFFGLGEKQGSRGRFEDQFKEVIYLNGGLFAVHSVERELGIDKQAVAEAKFGEGTKIPDSEFKKWFAYFEKWRWTLDEDKVENDGYISPHILGYIFEKYINQKQMGAYYTKEDITGYICRNTIIPRLFDMLASESERTKDPRFKQAVLPLPIGPHPNFFNEGRGISNGEGIDRYIYGCIKQHQNLAGETEFEQSQRRKRYEGILRDFDAEKIQQVDDFITYNLDIEKLAVDFIGGIQDPEVLHSFYFKGLQQITILDPTCGSGAFLFEALVILYPIYNACLSRMRYLVNKTTGAEPDIVNWGDRLHFDDLEIDQSTLADLVGSGSSKAVADFRAEVERINDHPSAEYFIKKTIIVNNLYGVDIMEEAVEICKLRLFLTLIATVERDDYKDNFGVEPLPDIDFNILAGNTLVGYESMFNRQHTRQLASSTVFDFDGEDDDLRDELQKFRIMLQHWRQSMLGDTTVPIVSKSSILAAAEHITPRLDHDLFRLFKQLGLLSRVVGKNPNGAPKVETFTERQFKRISEPFHWLLAFPGVEAAGGFEVIIGNPPYVEISPKEVPYSIPNTLTYNMGNLYAPCFVRSLRLLGPNGRLGLIVPMSISSIREYIPLMQDFTKSLKQTWVTNHAIRPQALFDGISQRVSICMGAKNGFSTPATFSTRYVRTDEPGTLFNGALEFSLRSAWSIDGIFPKLSSPMEHEIIAKLRQYKPYSRLGTGSSKVWMKDYGETYWIFPTSFQPFRTPLKSYKTVTLPEEDQLPFVGFLNSSLFYWFYHSISDCWHLGMWHLRNAPFGLERMSQGNRIQLAERTKELMLQMVATRIERYDKRANGTIYEYRLQKCKSIIDKIDAILADHFGLNSEELDFIRTYDQRYRMGPSSEGTSEGTSE